MATTTKRTTNPTHTELGRQFVKGRSKNLLFSRGYWHIYEGGVWQPVHDAQVHKDVWALLEVYEKGASIK